jgi:hypothetical protein
LVVDFQAVANYAIHLMNIKNSYMLVQTVETDSIPAAVGIGFCTEDNNTNEKAVYGIIIMNILSIINFRSKTGNS